MKTALVDHFVRHVVEDIEMRDLERANDVDRHLQHIVRGGQSALTTELAPCRPQHAQNLCAVETLTFTVLTKTHGPSYSPGASEGDRRRLGRSSTVPVQEKSEYSACVFSVVKSNVSS